jgi:hypothetical protein
MDRAPAVVPCFLDKCLWRHNSDAAEGIEYQRVFVAGHDEIGLAVHGDFEELVVARVSAGQDTGNNGNHDSSIAQDFHELEALVPLQIAVELGPQCNAEQLGKRLV